MGRYGEMQARLEDEGDPRPSLIVEVEHLARGRARVRVRARARVRVRIRDRVRIRVWATV